MPYFLVYSQTPVEKNDITITAASEWPSCQGSEFKWISTTYKPILWLFKKIKACKSRSLLTNQSAPIDKANLQMWDKGGRLQSPRCQLQHQKWQMTTPLTEFGEGHQGSAVCVCVCVSQYSGERLRDTHGHGISWPSAQQLDTSSTDFSDIFVSCSLLARVTKRKKRWSRDRH